MSTHRIYMEAIDDLPAGWYGSTGATINRPIYWRVPKEKALLLPKEQVIYLVRDMRRLGYPCKAEPEIHITEVI